jgi:hypothetical protein
MTTIDATRVLEKSGSFSAGVAKSATSSRQKRMLVTPVKRATRRCRYAWGSLRDRVFTTKRRSLGVRGSLTRWQPL